MNNDSVCLCGHTLIRHWAGHGSCHMAKSGYLINLPDVNMRHTSRYADDCKEFRLDNLKYLEQESLRKER